MKIDDIRGRLSLAEAHVASGEGVIKRQLQVIAHLDEIGGDSAEARNLLQVFKTVQAGFVEDRDRFSEELRTAMAGEPRR